LKRKRVRSEKMKKFLKVSYFGIAFYILLSVHVKAYIDPSVATYVIQIGAGVVIAVGALIGIYFRKTKKKISEKLGIDENKNKEVESDDIFDESEEETKPKTKTTKSKSKKK